jgi:hypothetical protein
MDHYLKFTDESEMLAVFSEAKVLHADDDGNVTSEATFIDGWHVNWRGELPESLEAHEIESPTTPARVWA